jgi:hypothetical protein
MLLLRVLSLKDLELRDILQLKYLIMARVKLIRKRRHMRDQEMLLLLFNMLANCSTKLIFNLKSMNL